MTFPERAKWFPKEGVLVEVGSDAVARVVGKC
jgi:hypothetical protein